MLTSTKEASSSGRFFIRAPAAPPKMLEAASSISLEASLAMKLLQGGGMRMMKLSSKGWHVRLIKLSPCRSFLEWGAGSWRSKSKTLRLSDVAEVAIDRPGFNPLPSDWTFFFLGIDDGGGNGIERWVPLGCKRPQEARMWIVALSQVLTPAAALFAQQIVGAASAAPPPCDSSGRDDNDDDVDTSDDGGGDRKQDGEPGEFRRERRRAARGVTEDRSGGVGGGVGGVDTFGMEAAAAVLPAFDPLRRLDSGAQRALSVRRRRTGSVDFSRLSARSAGRRGSCHAQQQMQKRPHGMRRVFSALDVRTARTSTARYAQLENRDQIVGVGLGLLNKAFGTRLSSTRGKALRSGSLTVPLATSVASSSTESGGPWKFGRRLAEGVNAGSTSASSALPEGKVGKEEEDGGPAEPPLRTSDEIVRRSLEGEDGDNDDGDDGETIGDDDGEFGSHRRSTSLPAGLMNPIYKKDRSIHFASIPHIVSILTDEFESNERLREMLLLTRPAFAPTSLELLRPFVAQFRNVRAASSRASNGTPLSRRIHGHMSRKLHPRNESERLEERSLVRSSLSCLNGGMGSSRGSSRRSFGSVAAHPQPTESEPAGWGDRSNAPPSASMRQLRVLSLLNLWLKRDYAATDLVHDVEANAFLTTFLVDLSDSLVPGVGKTAVNLLTRLRALEVEVAERRRAEEAEEANQRGSSSSRRRDKSTDAFLRIHASSLDIASSRERQGTLEREGTARILTTVLPKKFISSLEVYTACEIAEQLSLIDFAYLYKHINPRALINKTWSKQGKHGSDWAAGKMVDLFNQRVRWIGTEMTKPGSHISWPTRVKMLQLFIDIGRESLRLNNFHLLFQIIGGIEQQFITQLKSLWSALPDPYHETYSELKDVVDPKGNYRVYREHLAAVATERH